MIEPRYKVEDEVLIGGDWWTQPHGSFALRVSGRPGTIKSVSEQKLIAGKDAMSPFYYHVKFYLPEIDCHSYAFLSEDDLAPNVNMDWMYERI